MASGPPNKFYKHVRIDDLTGDQVLLLINAEADAGANTFVFAHCADGDYLFFGNYSS